VTARHTAIGAREISRACLSATTVSKASNNNKETWRFQMNIKILCNRCNTPVSFDEVSPGYWAVCPEHNEDLFMIECKLEVME
jgi:hypothetical protein